MDSVGTNRQAATTLPEPGATRQFPGRRCAVLVVCERPQSPAGECLSAGRLVLPRCLYCDWCYHHVCCCSAPGGGVLQASACRIAFGTPVCCRCHTSCCRLCLDSRSCFITLWCNAQVSFLCAVCQGIFLHIHCVPFWDATRLHRDAVPTDF